MNMNDNPKLNIELPEVDDNFTHGEVSEFNFEQPRSNIFTALGEDIAEQPEQSKIMDCVCPKCAEKTEINLVLMPENGFVTSCSSCNKKIHIVRESCAGRAKRKSYEINCANCGKQLDQHAHCHSCGIIFPDYFITVNPEDARRQARKAFFCDKWSAIKDFKFSFKPHFEVNSHDIAINYTPAGRLGRAVVYHDTSSLFSRKLLVFATSIIVGIALIVSGVLVYKSHQSRQAYAKDYFKTLNLIKTGVDTNLKICNKMKAEWELASASGRNFSPVISNIDDTDLIMLRSEVDKRIEKVSESPEKFARANEKLFAIHKIYLDTEALILMKPNSILEFGSSVSNLNNRMIQVSQDLKSNLPDALKLELVNAKLKYRGMKDF